MESLVDLGSNVESGTDLFMQIPNTYRLLKPKAVMELLLRAASRPIAQLDRKQMGSHRPTHGWNVIIPLTPAATTPSRITSIHF